MNWHGMLDWNPEWIDDKDVLRKATCYLCFEQGIEDEKEIFRILASNSYGLELLRSRSIDDPAVLRTQLSCHVDCRNDKRRGQLEHQTSSLQ